MLELEAGPCSIAGESGPDRSELEDPQNADPPEPPGSKEAGEVIAVTGGRIVLGVLRGSEVDANDCSKGLGS